MHVMPPCRAITAVASVQVEKTEYLQSLVQLSCLSGRVAVGSGCTASVLSRLVRGLLHLYLLRRGDAILEGAGFLRPHVPQHTIDRVPGVSEILCSV